VLVYFLVIALPAAILLPVFGGSFIAGLLGAGVGYSAALFGIVALYVAALLNLFIGGAWLHLWVYVLGGKQGIKQTWKAMIYASTPSLLLGWIPFVNIFTGLWTFILTLLFIGDMQKIGWPKALLAVIIAGIIPALIVFLAVGSLLSALMYTI